ncbi:hypothetical protein CsatB_020281 [Cannabis sativa]
MKQTHNIIPHSTNKIGSSAFQPRNHQCNYADIIDITNNFEKIIGKGGFGTVFHGYLNDTQVAVKILSESSAQGYKEFQAEVNLLMRVHHKNLTSLVGYCIDDKHMGLIYEYMANGNLGRHLSDKQSYTLSWEERLQIAVDAAHVIAKINSNENIHISQWVENMLYENGEIQSVVDPRLRGNFQLNSTWKAMELATNCVHLNSIERPTMNQVVVELKECLALEITPEKDNLFTKDDLIRKMTLNIDTHVNPLPRIQPRTLELMDKTDA